MFARTSSAIRRAGLQFRRDTEGSIAMTFALVLIPVTVAVGASIDYSWANSFKTVLQATLDSSVLAGAKDGSSNWAQIALNVFQSNLAGRISSTLTPTYTMNGDGTYSGQVTGSVPT